MLTYDHLGVWLYSIVCSSNGTQDGMLNYVIDIPNVTGGGRSGGVVTVAGGRMGEVS